MPTVLIVEDDDDFRASLAELLQMEGWTAVMARGVDDAWDAARCVHIDVVLSDVLLFGARGVDLKPKFKADPNLAAIPFVFMTGHRPHVDELAPDCVLVKPFAIDALGESLSNAISSRW